MANILALSEATSLSTSKTALEAQARSVDEKNLWPIVAIVINGPWHISYMTIEEAEEFSAKFKSYLEDCSLEDIEKRPMILKVILACLLRIGRTLQINPNIDVSLDNLPIMNALSKHHIFNYDENSKLNLTV